MIMGYTPKVKWVDTVRTEAVPTVMQRIEALNYARGMAYDNILKAQAAMKIAHKGNKRFKPYQKGDLVLLEGTNLQTIYPTAKLAPKRYGPMKVLEQLSEATYRLEIPPQWKIHNVFHANLLTPYKETELHGPNYSRPPPDIISGSEEFEVEKILDAKKRGRGRKLHYLIKWKGYPTSDNSWEKAEDVHTDELIAEFNKRKQTQDNRRGKTYIRTLRTTEEKPSTLAYWAPQNTSSSSYQYPYAPLAPKPTYPVISASTMSALSAPNPDIPSLSPPPSTSPSVVSAP